MALTGITTWRSLGRGGSDTSAVAIAAVMRADRCQILQSVDGVPPDREESAGRKEIGCDYYDEMLELATLGAQVLNNRSVRNGQKIRR